MSTFASSDDWVLHYWGPTFKGRGEFVRLLFEAAGVKYTENNDGGKIVALNDMGGSLGEGLNYPSRFPPVVTGPDGYVCSQTPAILWSLGRKFGMSPDDERNQTLAMQLNITASDFIAEGRLAFHAKAPVGSYSTQAEETKPRIEWFRTSRLSDWLSHFEHCFANSTDKGATYFFESKLTYVDIAIFHILNATEAQFPEDWAKLKPSVPLLAAFHSRMKEIPRIKAYLESDRVKPWAGDSMM